MVVLGRGKTEVQAVGVGCEGVDVVVIGAASVGGEGVRCVG